MRDSEKRVYVNRWGRGKGKQETGAVAPVSCCFGGAMENAVVEAMEMATTVADPFQHIVQNKAVSIRVILPGKP